MTDKCVIIQVEAVEQIAEIRDKAMRKIESSPLKEFADWCEVAQLLDWICGTIEAAPEPASAEPVLWFLPHNDGSYSTQKEKPSNIGPHSDWLPLCAHATKQEQWIPVSEQQPPTDEPVLYMRKGESKISVGIAYWSVSSKWIPESQSVHCPNGFTHWMPLPQPPQE